LFKELLGVDGALFLVNGLPSGAGAGSEVVVSDASVDCDGDDLLDVGLPDGLSELVALLHEPSDAIGSGGTGGGTTLPDLEVGWEQAVGQDSELDGADGSPASQELGSKRVAPFSGDQDDEAYQAIFASGMFSAFPVTKIATPVELADETPLISLMEIDPSVTLIVGRTKTPKPLGKYTFLIKVVESVLVRSPGNEVFMTPGKHNKGGKSVMAAVNAKAGRKCPAGMVAAVLRDFFGLRVKQENICGQCNRRCTKANCGTHYGSASGKRNRLMVCWDAALKPAA